MTKKLRKEKRIKVLREYDRIARAFDRIKKLTDELTPSVDYPMNNDLLTKWFMREYLEFEEEVFPTKLPVVKEDDCVPI